MIQRVVWEPSAQEDWLRFVEEAVAANPNEYIESVIGRISGEMALIRYLWPVKHDGRKASVMPNTRSIGQQRRAAANEGAEWLGFLHTHPDTRSAYLSDGDHACGTYLRAAIIGSCHITGTKMLTVNEPYWLIPQVLPNVRLR